MVNPSQPIPKDSHHKSQDIITSLTSYYVWPFKTCWEQKVTHTHSLIKYAQYSATSNILATLYKTNIWQISLTCLHGQLCGHQFLILDLKAFKVFTSFNSVGIITQILGPKNDRLSVPLYALLIGGIEKCEVWRSW